MIGVIIILKKQEYLDNIAQILAELEIFNTSIIEGNNLEGILERDIPLFAGLFSSINREKLFNYTIISIFPNKNKLDTFYKLLKGKHIMDNEEEITIFSFNGNIK